MTAQIKSPRDASTTPRRSGSSANSAEAAAKKKRKFVEAAKSSKQGWKISDFLKNGDGDDSS